VTVGEDIVSQLLVIARNEKRREVSEQKIRVQAFLIDLEKAKGLGRRVPIKSL
jgi:hypothetical protein